MGRLDQQLALYEFFGGYSTTLSSSASAGVTTLELTASVSIGSIMLDTGSAFEIVIVTAVTGSGPYTATLRTATLYDHSAGASVAPFSTASNSVFPFVNNIVMGEPITMEDNKQPVLFVLSPKAKETREYAQKKFITYTLSVVLVTILVGLTRDDQGASSIMTFYGWMDQIADKIRTNKQLITPSYPQGASIKFGETFTTSETHERVENSVWLVAKYDIESIEQVNA